MKKLGLLFSLLLFNPLLAQTQLGADIDGEAAYDLSGRAVSLSSDGTIVAIGAPHDHVNGNGTGQVRVYEYVAGSWTQLGADIDGESADDQFGISVSLSSDGTILAIGAHFNSDNGVYSGHVRVFEYSAGSWIQLGADIDGEAADDRSGISVSLSSDGTILAIGAPYNDGNGSDAGHVRIYEYSGGSWIQLGSDIDGESAGDYSGPSSLSSDGSIIAISADGNDGNGNSSGHVRVFEYSAGSWTQLGADIDGEAMLDGSHAVSLSSDGTIVAIGSYGNDGNGSNAGHVRVYEYNGGSWTQIGADIDGEASTNYSGCSVSLSSDGSTVAIGAYGNSDNGTASGHVRVFEYSVGSWTQIGTDIDGEAAFDRSGYFGSVSLSSDGSTVAIGAPYNDGNGTDAGHVRVFALPSITVCDVYDTTYINVFDTIAVFDTIQVFDTTAVFDTNYVDVFDTTYIDVHDTIFVTQIDTIYLTVADTLIIDVSLIGINPPTFEYQVLVYPNPTNNYLYVDVPQSMISQSYSMEIKNSIGQSVFGIAMNQPQIQINFNSFGAAGSYTLSIKDSGGNVVDTRMIILQ